MIDKANDPAAWSLLLYELSDAQEHLRELLKKASDNSAYTEEDFQIDLGHVYAHLNRAWHRRNLRDDFHETEWEAASRFPNDLDPIG